MKQPFEARHDVFLNTLISVSQQQQSCKEYITATPKHEKSHPLFSRLPFDFNRSFAAREYVRRTASKRDAVVRRKRKPCCAARSELWLAQFLAAFLQPEVRAMAGERLGLF